MASGRPEAAVRGFKTIVIMLLTLGIALLALQNQQPVETYFLFFTFEMPQVVLLFLTASAGFSVGLLVALRVGRRRRPDHEIPV